MKNVQIRSFFWSIFSCIWSEYRDLPRKFPHSVRIQENTDQKKLHIGTLSAQCTLKLNIPFSIMSVIIKVSSFSISPYIYCLIYALNKEKSFKLSIRYSSSPWLDASPTDTDVLKWSRYLTTKPGVAKTSGKRCLIYDVLKTSNLRRLQDV